MQPFSRDQIALIRASLKARGHPRDMALFSLGIDAMLRGGDLLALKVADVRDIHGRILDRLTVLQGKTRTPVHITLTQKTRELLAALIEAQGKWGDDFLFTPDRAPHGKALTEVSLRRLVKSWAELCHLDPRRYSNHSLRRSKAVYVYRETRNAEAVRQMLGHSSLRHTVAYLGVGAEEVSDLARKFDI
jgi:integrase